MMPTAGSATNRKSRKTTAKDEFAAIHRLAAEIQSLQQDAVRAYTPIVDALVRENSCDVRTIEQTLDGLLSFCAHEPALELYKKLCRHYFTLDPAATAEYVYAYREMWDEEEAATIKADIQPPVEKNRKKVILKTKVSCRMKVGDV